MNLIFLKAKSLTSDNVALHPIALGNLVLTFPYQLLPTRKINYAETTEIFVIH